MDALYEDPALAAFYDWDNPWPTDFDWFLTLVDGAGSVLDLGCGTGVFSVALALKGAEVVGADPATAMLAIARARQGGQAVNFVTAPVQGLDLGRRFDAVVMTGHAFQTLLTPTDRAACLATIARHLAPGGRFFFDSRNPEAREWLDWTPEATREVRAHPEHGQVERWNAAEETEVPGVIEYQTHYRVPDGRHWQARSRIAFPGFPELSKAIADAGLQVDRRYGDPAGGAVRSGCPDFIPVGTLA
jgi:SAM-dependent methyltransferase